MAEAEDLSAMAASFDRAADSYEKGRPEYPAEAVDVSALSNDTRHDLNRAKRAVAAAGRLDRALGASNVAEALRASIELEQILPASLTAGQLVLLLRVAV